MSYGYPHKESFEQESLAKGSHLFTRPPIDDIPCALNDDDDCPRLYLVGGQQVGKTSIAKVIWNRLTPRPDNNLEETLDVQCRMIDTNPLVRFKVVEFPANYKFVEDDETKENYMKIDEETKETFMKCDIMVFVVDALDAPNYDLEYLLHVANVVRQVNKNTHFEMLIHKVDDDLFMGDSSRTDLLRDVTDWVRQLTGAGKKMFSNFHLTSIYDSSIFEAFSKILMKIIPEIGFLESSLDHLISTCQVDKAFLIDAISRTYVSSDSSPVEKETFELCSELVKVTVDVMTIYSSSTSGRQVSDDEAFSPGAAAVVKLTNKGVLYLKRISKLLALVMVMKEDTYRKMPLILGNVDVFQRAVNGLLALKRKGAEARAKWEAEQKLKKARGKNDALDRHYDDDRGDGGFDDSRSVASGYAR